MPTSRYSVLPLLIAQEGTDFYHVTNIWQPKGLLPDPYRRNMLKDVQRRFNWLEEGESEFRTLDRSPTYIRLIRRMRLYVRQAQFAWRTDDLKFLQNVTRFYSDYGAILRNLKVDHMRGKFTPR